MNTKDFEGAGSGKTRIGAPIRRGEKVLVPILREDFQERFLQIYDLADEAVKLTEEHNEAEMTVDGRDEIAFADLGKRMEISQMTCEIKTKQLWLDIQMHYNIWNRSIGVRDGFVLVECREDANPINKLKRKMGRLGGMSAGFIGPDAKHKMLLSESDIPADAPEEVKQVLRKLIEIMRDFDKLNGGE